MKLLLDLGNSRLKWAQASDGIIGSIHALDYRRTGFLPDLKQLWQDIEPPQKIAVSSVSGKQLLQDIIELSRSLWPKVECLIPHSSSFAFGVKNAYQQPEKLGIDRWLALIASHKHYPGNVCVVDCGTAITCDVLQAHGIHLGGLICPGLTVMQKALAANTADLSLITETPRLELATSTDKAIANGVLIAAIGLIEKTIGRLDHSYRLILTGGDADILSSTLSIPSQVDPQLIFKGLLIVCAGEQSL